MAKRPVSLVSQVICISLKFVSEAFMKAHIGNFHQKHTNSLLFVLTGA